MNNKAASKVFFISDLHFGHENIIRFDNRPFINAEHMNAEIIRRWNEKVSKTDTVYVLGDVSWCNLETTKKLVTALNGRKHLIRGNHDRISEQNKCGFETVQEYKEIKLDGRKIVLCHYPIPFFNNHYYGAYMLYGHVHNTHEWNIVENWKAELQRLGIPCNMYNVGAMIFNYEPVTLEEIINDARFQPKETEGLDGD